MTDQLASEKKAVYSAALAMLTRREYSEYELRSKLLRKFSSFANTIQLVIDSLLEQNYLCDKRFCEAYIRARSRKGFGSIRIRQELNEKGVGSTFVETALKESDVNWVELARTVRVKKYRCEPQDYKERAKHQGFLRYRGFDSDAIQRSFEEPSGCLDPS